MSKGQDTSVAGAASFRKRTLRLDMLISDLNGLRPIARNLWRVYGRKTIDPALRERIMVGVAEVNECRFCSFAHHEWAIAAGADAEALPRKGGERDAASDAREAIAIGWAQMFAQANLGPVPEAVDRRLRLTFTPAECHDIEVVVRAMRLLNLTANTVDALAARLRGAQIPQGRAVDELLIAMFAIPALALAVLLMAGAQRRSPLAVWTALRAFSSGMEQRLAGRSPAQADVRRPAQQVMNER